MTRRKRSIVLHGHFYQPPREDPWTDEVPEQPSATPFHDWNERIEAECYGPVVRSRVVGADGAPDEYINSLEWMSFNFGPTLLVWLERHAPATYAAVLAADRASRRRLGGYGNAIAMPYHHTILPLATERDRLTEIRWGIRDFRSRFGRDPEGMWLPETAVDDATLHALAGEGIGFTILAPHQIDRVPDDGRPALYRTIGGREIALCVYDGALSHGVAFGNLLNDGVAWAAVMADDPDAPALRSLATDGETFGHHHRFGEMALAKAIVEVRTRPHIRLENFASFLAREGAGRTVDLVEPSAWSCAHGVERWRADCGCKTDTGRDWSQAWRAPLRGALEWLAGELHAVFEREGGEHFADPWAARDDYVAILTRSGSVDAAAKRPAGGGGRAGDASADTGNADARRLLEMERDALRLFTSCAWFFDDIAGIEPRQVLSYAAHALELAGPEQARLRRGLVERLAKAESNDPDEGTGADVFEDVAASHGGARVR